MPAVVKYCAWCRHTTTHDRCHNAESPSTLLGRLTMGVLTLGLTELCRQEFWRCRRCLGRS